MTVETKQKPVYVGVAQHSRVRIYAAQNDLSIKTFVAQAIDEKLKSSKKRIKHED